MKTVKISEIVGGGYDRFWNDKHRYRVLKGGKGSKKSTTTALNFIFRIMNYKDSNLLVVRHIMNTHRDSTFAQLKWAQEKLGVSHLWANTTSPYEMTYIPTGQKILFRGFDDVLKLASTTVSKGYLCWVWIEEAYEIQSESDFEKLDLSVPRGQISEGLFKQTTLTFNPWSERHWLKKRFFDTADKDVSTYTTDYRQNEFLTEADINVFLRMKKQSYTKYMVAGLGNWGISEGLVYDNFEVKSFLASELGITRDENGKITEDKSWQYKSFFGLDFGYANDPTAFIALAVNNIDKTVWIYDEFSQKKLLNSDIARLIKEKGYSKERIRADCAEPKSIDDLRRLGIGRILPSVKGRDSILAGIAQISEYKIYVSPACKDTIAELSSYRYEKDSSDKLLNRPIDEENHLMDAMRYAFNDVSRFKPAPNGKRIGHRERAEINSSLNSSIFMGGWE